MKHNSFFVLFAACVLAFGQQKEKPPEGGPPKPFHLPHSEDFTLRNGMKVTLVPYGIVPRVAIRAYVNAGGIDEPADKVWLSRLTGLLMKEGTKSRSSEQIAAEAADCGARLEIEAGVEFTTVGGVALADHAAQFISLISDVLQNASFPESQVPRLKADLLRELAVAKTQPDELARERFLKTIFPESAYGRAFPSDSELRGYTLQDAQQFYRDNFGAARTHLYIAGKLDPALRDSVRTVFESWAQGPAPPLVPASSVKRRSFALMDRPGASQSTLYIGLIVADPTSPDYVSLDVMNALLGGSFASRITANIREQKGYTYSPFSQIGTRTRLAYWVEVADVTTAVTGPSIKEIFSEIDRLRKEPPSEAELKGIQAYLAGLFVLRNTISPDAVIGQLHFVDSQGLHRSFLSDYVGRVMAVSPQEIQGVTEKYVVPDKMAIVVVGDKSKIADQLTQYQNSAQ